MSFVDYKYIGLISSRVERFKDNGNHVYQMRCKFCGDSKKKKSLARGYIYSKENKFRYHCHNCGASMPLGQFIKLVAPDLYMAYMVDSFHKEGTKPLQKTTEKTYHKIQTNHPFLDKCIKLSKVDKSNPVYQYAIHRKIPEQYFDDFMSCANINHITGMIDKYNHKKYPNHQSLVIPFYNKNRELPQLQCRMLAGDLRYITLTLDDNVPKIFGLKYINWRKTVYVTEGPIDSLFIPNCLAIGGLKNFRAMDYIEHKTKDLVYIFDADWKYNPDVKRTLLEKIEKNHKLVILKNDFGAKDINEYIMNGNTTQNLIDYVEKNTFHGLRAKLETVHY